MVSFFQLNFVSLYKKWIVLPILETIIDKAWENLRENGATVRKPDEHLKNNGRVLKKTKGYGTIWIFNLSIRKNILITL